MHTRNRAKKTPLIELLQRTTYHEVYGELTEYGVRPSVTIKEFVDRKQARWWLRRLSNYKFERHFTGEHVYYFMGSPSKTAPYTLAIIDIDVQKDRRIKREVGESDADYAERVKRLKGSPEGAIAFAQHLKRTYWPTLVWEKSRSGKGLGMPVFIKKDGRSAKEVNAMLMRLDRFLKAEARKVGAAIENVEVMGKLPIVQYHKYGGVEDIQFGSFARYPRRLSYDQVSNAPVLSCEEWLLKHVPEPVKDKKPNLNVGSVNRHPIKKDELAMIPHYEKLFRRLVGGDLKANARFLVTAHDFAIACVLLRFFKKNPNKDGTMPTSRARKLWTGLHEAGAVQRPWNDRRWKRIRDWLSEHGHIDWQDDRFQPANAKLGLTGIACKWCITDEFFDVLESINLKPSTEKDIFIDTCDVKSGPGKWLTPRLYPIQREKEAKFWSEADSRLEMLLAA